MQKQKSKNPIRRIFVIMSAILGCALIFIYGTKTDIWTGSLMQTPARQQDRTGDTVSLPFTDVHGHWAEPFITDLWRQDIIDGKTENSFDPDTTVTRAELTKIAVTAFDIPLQAKINGLQFNDVERKAWYVPYINAGHLTGIIRGYSDGNFRPDKLVSRAEALKVLLAAAVVQLPTGQNEFFDVRDEEWFAPYVTFGIQNNIIDGYGDGSFRPFNPITRAEIAKLTFKILEL